MHLLDDALALWPDERDVKEFWQHSHPHALARAREQIIPQVLARPAARHGEAQSEQFSNMTIRARFHPHYVVNYAFES